MVIERAAAGDLEAVFRLLEDSGLPVDGLANHADTVIVARDDHQVVGSAALELYGRHALLRSVAVARPLRGVGLGHQLTQAALTLARERGVEDVFLLTTTAEDFFPRFGFVSINRQDVPDPIQRSVEFTSACPASAVALRKSLAGTT